MAGWHLSEQARRALRTARVLARERDHTALGPGHLLAAILRQWDDRDAAGPALLRVCGLSAEQATALIPTLVAAYDPAGGEAEAPPRATDPAAEPRPSAPAAELRPSPALRLVLAHAERVATEARSPYVGTEHLVLAIFWLDGAPDLRRLGITYQRAAEPLATLPRTEQLADSGAIEPLEAMAVPAPAASALAELARQQAEQHPVDGRVTTLHYLLALLMGRGAARNLLRELGVSYNTVRERVAADGAGLAWADDQRPEEEPLEGWERFDITPDDWEVIHPRVGPVLFDGGLWERGVRFGFNFNQEGTRYWVIIHPGESGLIHEQVLDRLLDRVP
ncbi:MAG TPA: Clp protease N-terminal domain-containing protein [Actinomycetes bacterium]|nr:Clp protease N-terminal domain-containing protein [Actinomycetes bacterium]